jgi:hypothetical protein
MILLSKYFKSLFVEGANRWSRKVNIETKIKNKEERNG